MILGVALLEVTLTRQLFAIIGISNFLMYLCPTAVPESIIFHDLPS